MLTLRLEPPFSPMPVWGCYCPWTRLLPYIPQVNHSFEQRKKAPCPLSLREIGRAAVQGDCLATRQDGQNGQRALARSSHLKIRVLLCWSRNPRVGCIVRGQTHTSSPQRPEIQTRTATYYFIRRPRSSQRLFTPSSAAPPNHPGPFGATWWVWSQSTPSLV